MSCSFCTGELRGLHARMQGCTCPCSPQLGNPQQPLQSQQGLYQGDLSICPTFLTQEQFDSLKSFPKYRDDTTLFRKLLGSMVEKPSQVRDMQLKVLMAMCAAKRT